MSRLGCRKREGKRGKYRNLVKQSLQGIAIAQSIPPRIVFSNPAMTEILGYSHNEIILKSYDELRELVHPEDREVFFKDIEIGWKGKR